MSKFINVGGPEDTNTLLNALKILEREKKKYAASGLKITITDLNDEKIIPTILLRGESLPDLSDLIFKDVTETLSMRFHLLNSEVKKIGDFLDQQS